MSPGELRMIPALRDCDLGRAGLSTATTLILIALLGGVLSDVSVAQGPGPDARGMAITPTASPTPTATPGCPRVELPSEVPVSRSFSSLQGASDLTGPCGGDGSPEETFSFTAPIAGTYAIDTFGSDFYTALYVLDGGCSGFPLACDADSLGFGLSRVTVLLDKDQQVVVVVDASFGGSGGNGVLTIQSNDPTPTPTRIPGCPQIELPGEVPLSMPISTIEGHKDLSSPCGGVFGPERTLSFVAPVAGTYVMDTFGSNFDTILYLLDRTCSGRLLACNDDANGPQSMLHVPLEAGQAIVVVVDAFGPTGGDAILNIRLDTEATTPTPVPGCPGVELAGDPRVTVQGTTNSRPDELRGPCGGGGAPEATFEYTAPQSGIYSIDTFGSAFDTVLTVYEGGCDGEVLGCNDDAAGFQSSVSLSLNAGQRIAVAVDGFGSSVGDFTLNISANTDQVAIPCSSDTDCRPDENCRCCSPGARRCLAVSEPCFPGNCSNAPTATVFPTGNPTPTPTPPNPCGNGVLDGSEQCDDGNMFGGDGCASNCTSETASVFAFDGVSSDARINLSITGEIRFPLRGSATFVMGSPGPNGEIPVTIPAALTHIAPIPISLPPFGLCACLRPYDPEALGLSDPGFGPGNAGAGLISCGRGLEGTSYRVDAVGPLIDNSATREVERSDSFREGAGQLRVLVGLSAFFDGGTCAQDFEDATKGNDGLPCTDDDVITFGVDIIELTTGSALAFVQDRDGVVGDTLSIGPVSGDAFDCDAIPTGGPIERGRLAFASSEPTVPFGDLTLAGRLEALCHGDCDGDGIVSLPELVQIVRIASGATSAGTCPGLDLDRDGRVMIDEVVATVAASINGCGHVASFVQLISTATRTPTPTASRTPTVTPTLFDDGLPTSTLPPKPTPTSCRIDGDNQCCLPPDNRGCEGDEVCRCCEGARGGRRVCVFSTGRCAVGVCD